MPFVVGVTFRKVGKVYYFDPGKLPLNEGDFVIAETARGPEFGEIVIEPREISNEELVAPLKKVIRIATPEDLNRESSNREKEKEALEVCEKKVLSHSLPMKLLDAEISFDCSQVTFSFSADGRIDFRELVKDVANVLKMKVQLHQIGVRDEAKLIGGYGTCGRSLCCSTYISTFEPISMKMAKDQSLFLNPAKFSGCCGKLMCCLRYEHEFYKYAQQRLPNVGAILSVDDKRARVIDVNVVSNSLTLETEDGVQIHMPAKKFNLEGLCRRHGNGCPMSDKHCQPLLAGDEPFVEEEILEEDSFIIDEWAEPVIEDNVINKKALTQIPPVRQNQPQRNHEQRSPREDRSEKPSGPINVVFRDPKSAEKKPIENKQSVNPNNPKKTNDANVNRNKFKKRPNFQHKRNIKQDNKTEDAE
jgi:cell fate regulator YaaT (PSP1 superfamily)